MMPENIEQLNSVILRYVIDHPDEYADLRALFDDYLIYCNEQAERNTADLR